MHYNQYISKKNNNMNINMTKYIIMSISINKIKTHINNITHMFTSP